MRANKIKVLVSRRQLQVLSANFTRDIATITADIATTLQYYNIYSNKIKNLEKFLNRRIKRSMRVREIPINTQAVTGYFYSVKNCRTIACESLIERDLYFSLEFDDNIESYQEQPLKVPSGTNGSSRPYFVPDCLVTYRSETGKRPLLVEVKPQSDFHNIKKQKDLKRKIAILKAYAAENGMDFKVVTDKDLRGPYLENLKFLYKFIQEPQDFHKYKEAIVTTLQGTDQGTDHGTDHGTDQGIGATKGAGATKSTGTTQKAMTVTELLNTLAPEKHLQGQIIKSIWHLLYLKAIKTDLSSLLTNSSRLELARMSPQLARMSLKARKSLIAQ